MAAEVSISKYIDEHFEISESSCYDQVKDAVTNILKTKLGVKLVDEIFKKSIKKIQISTDYDTWAYSGDRDIIAWIPQKMYIIEGKGFEKFVSTNIFDFEAILFHEMIHKLQYLTLGQDEFLKQFGTAPDDCEYSNKIEEDTIKKGFCGFSEHAYCQERSFPIRNGHVGQLCAIPPASEIPNDLYYAAKAYLITYLSEGAVKDFEIISKRFTEEEVKTIIENFMRNIPESGVYFSFNSLKYLLTIKNIKIDSNILSNFILRRSSFVNLENIKELESLGFDFSFHDGNKQNILFYLSPNQPNYLEIIKYLVLEKKLDINHKSYKGKFFDVNKNIPKDILVELQKMGATI